MDCQYIWNAHAASGRREGLGDGLVDALRDISHYPHWRWIRPPS